MKLTVFNAENTPQWSTGTKTPGISFGKAGGIAINQTAAELMGLKPEDTISFGQDEEDPANWFVWKDPKGYRLRLHSDQKTLAMNHSVMCNNIRQCFELDHNCSHRFIIAGKPTVIDKVKYYGLILRSK
jgi:hypothetical protein